MFIIMPVVKCSSEVALNSKLVVPSAVHAVLNLTYDHSLLNMSIRLCGIGSRRVEE